MEKSHFQVIAALALLEGKEEALALLEVADASYHESLQSFFDRFQETPAEKLPETLRNFLRAFQAQESFSGIAEIHPAWLLEALKKESPRVIGVILRHLPSKHVRYLLEHLPRSLVMRLPKLIEAFYVPTEILNLVRRRFERHFVPMRISREIRQFEFEHLFYLKIEELNLLFRDLGLSELALALQGLPRQLMKVILNRFSIQDAKEALSRMKRFSNEEKWLLNDAKYSILELQLEAHGPENFLKELGLKTLAKGFGKADFGLFETLRQKFSPECAYLFKRCLEEQLLRFDDEKMAKRKEWVLEHIRRLSDQRKIDPMWSDSLKKEAA